MNRQIKNNPDWKPFLEAVEHRAPLWRFLLNYSAESRPAAAVALSLVKWHLIISGYTGYYGCGCCALYPGNCEGCPLHGGPNGFGCDDGSAKDVYSYILKIYTSHFNALPARDRQRVVA